ncbi:RHS repeat domain-containing protein [Chryseobacterium piperi]|uniref:RHS repeat domain-containing protein n=1 Tax=Chryseobacterium piperi TaxID=558152 RepID=UPI000A5C6751|nr:RHS repeat-associated core domain-containing protein [Chryseobacterium piperi]
MGNLCYLYRYDGRGRLVLKKLPGKAWEYMIYDKRDRLIMTQDAMMGASKQWLFTKYDAFGRVAYTGIYTSSQAYGLAGRAAEQSLADAKEGNNVTRTPNTTVGFTQNGMAVYYDNGSSSYPNAISQLLSVNYYDTYPPYSFNPPRPSTAITDNATANSVSTKSLPVMTLVKNIEDDNWTKNYSYYDNRGRVISAYSINHLGGYTKTDSQLDFAGVPQKVTTEHKRLTTDAKRVIAETFTYDHQNRLKIHKHKVDNRPEEILAQNDYNELSQLQSKRVGGVAIANPLEQMDYKYNIRGWMTHINDPHNLNGRLFGYSIKYNSPEFPASGSGRFNGNISEVDWATFNDGVLRRYNYQYDGLNRLSKGLYSEPYSSVVQNQFFNEELTYDLNGNITTLKRNSKPASGLTAEVIDNLVYNYESNNQSNRLSSITLPSNIANNPSGYNALGNTISYDNNGRMINQLDKGINKIVYNYLNLPNNLMMGTGSLSQITNYIYRADGVKVRKQISGGVSPKVSQTEYLDGFQYQDGVLQFVPSAEGYYDFAKNKYIYNYTDHLGNIRLSYTNNGSGAEAIEENNYYPFGLKHERYNNVGGNSAYQYKYSGKELQTETGMYDYGARFYMADIGRWGVVDPLAEKMTSWSPYTFSFNNPLRYMDPDGRAPYDWVKDSWGWHWRSDITSKRQAMTAGYSDYSNGRTNNIYTTYLGSNGSGIGRSQEVVLGLNRNYTIDGISKIAPDTAPVNMKPVNDFGKFMAGFTAFPLYLEALPVLFSTEAIFTKATISLTSQAASTGDVDLYDFGADTFMTPGAGNLVGGLADYSLKTGEHNIYGITGNKSGRSVIMDILLGAAAGKASEGISNSLKTTGATETVIKNVSEYTVQTTKGFVNETLKPKETK